MSRAIFFPVVFLCACNATSTRPATSVATSATPVAVAQPETPSAALAETDAQPEKCVLVCGGAAALHVEAAVPDYHAADVANADGVFGAMHDDLLACYKARIKEKPNAHAFLVVDLIVASDGAVQKVDISGGALLGKHAVQCITKRIERAQFEPVRGDGTLHVQYRSRSRVHRWTTAFSFPVSRVETLYHPAWLS
ncbi:MAG: hypothetical protein ABI461_00420 [Polyangiaceae bacterium]